jgi:ribosomal protein S18 acetylase RimI-like enzyme
VKIGGMTDDVTIRALSPADWELKRQLRLEALRESPGAFLSTYAQALERTDEQWRSWPAGAVFAAFLGAEPVGLACGGQSDDQPGVTVLFSMWVAPSARGHRIAGRLIDAVTARAREQGSQRVRLDVFKTNDSAYRAYVGHGFTLDIQPSQTSGCVAMRLDLNGSVLATADRGDGRAG